MQGYKGRQWLWFPEERLQACLSLCTEGKTDTGCWQWAPFLLHFLQQAWITSGRCTSQTSTSPTGADHVPRTGPGTYQVLNKINAYLIQLLNGLHCFIVGVSCGMTVSVWSNDHILNSLSFKENGGKLVGSYQFI